jgi:hypothetical protein
MMTINRETFEAWLFAQTRGAVFRYGDCLNCLLAQFLKSSTSLKEPSVGGEYFRPQIGAEEVCRFPEWLLQLQRGFLHYDDTSSIPFGHVQDCYIKLFGDPSAVPAVEPIKETEAV